MIDGRTDFCASFRRAKYDRAPTIGRILRARAAEWGRRGLMDTLSIRSPEGSHTRFTRARQ